MSFSSDFLWGSATASYQIEGAVYEDGRGYTVWDDFCSMPGKILDSSSGDIACDHYHRYQEDISIMSNIGFKAYRFSIAWSRIFPEGIGEVNQKGIAFYNALIDQLLDKGITPYITLFHWDLPYALHGKGGWQNPQIVDWFAQYAQTVAAAFGDRVKHFITINEPQCFVGLGHITGEHAPGNRMSRRSVLEMAHHVMMAHGKAVQAIRSEIPDAKIGYAPTSSAVCPATNSMADVEAARKAYFEISELDNYMWNVSWWSDPVFLKQYPEDGIKLFEKDMPKIKSSDFDLIAQPLDFYGQNIYNGYTVKADQKVGYVSLKRPLGHPRTASNWPVVPESLYWAPKFLYERYKTPIFITENGLSCTDSVCLDGQIHDEERIDFIHRYLLELRRAISDGVDVKGYFAWSLLDNFEWGKGYTERFGLIHVDYQTQQRTWKDSAYWMKKLIANNGSNL